MKDSVTCQANAVIVREFKESHILEKGKYLKQEQNWESQDAEVKR